MALLPTANLKNTKHINLVLRSTGWSRSLAREFAGWLENHSSGSIIEERREAHLDELERRMAGKSLVSVSENTSATLRDLRLMPVVLEHFSYACFERLGLRFSFDVFNAGDELALGRQAPALTLELFAVEGSGITPLVELAIDAIDEWPIEYAFGGQHSFTAGFALAQLRASEAGHALRVQDFLWPFTFSRDFAQIDDGALQRLPVFRTGRADEGVWIWLFEDLYMGHSEAYLDAARSMGLRSLWEPEFFDV